MLSLSFGMTIVKEEIIYLNNVIVSFFSMKNFNYFESLLNFDYYDSIFWDNKSFKFDINILIAVLKIWSIGLLLSFNPYFYSFNDLNFNNVTKKALIFFSLLIFSSLMESLQTDSNNLMEVNYYFFKQSLVFIIIFILFCNFKELTNEIEKYNRIIFITEILLVYTILISLQYLFYKYVYPVYFLDIVLLLLAVSCRDKFDIKLNSYAHYLFLLIFLYEIIFYIFHKDLIVKDIIEKVLTISISLTLYFYKDFILELYRNKYPIKTEDVFNIDLVRDDFIKKFSNLIDVSKITNLQYNGHQYFINNEILFTINNHDSIDLLKFNFDIVFIKNNESLSYFIGQLANKMNFEQNLFRNGQKLKISGSKKYSKISLGTTMNLGMLEYLDSISQKEA
jgi:hypothetical protein